MAFRALATVSWELLEDTYGKSRRPHPRQPRRGGGGRGTPKLTPDQVRAIRASPKSPAEIALEFNIDRQYARKVQNGETHQQVR